MLAGLSRCGDTDDLARSALKDQEVTNADVMAGDGDGFRNSATTLDIADGLLDTITNAGGTTLTILFFNDHLFALVVGSERVEYTVCSLLKSVTERVVVTFVVVITHT